MIFGIPILFGLSIHMGFLFNSFGIYILRNVMKKSFAKTEKCTTAELWLIAVLVANVLIFASYIIGYHYLYLVGTITFSVVFYGLLVFFLSKKNRDTIFQNIPEKYAAKRIDSSEAQFLIDQLRQLMEEQELYKDTDIKLQKLPSKFMFLHTNYHNY